MVNFGSVQQYEIRLHLLNDYVARWASTHGQFCFFYAVLCHKNEELQVYELLRSPGTGRTGCRQLETSKLSLVEKNKKKFVKVA